MLGNLGRIQYRLPGFEGGFLGCWTPFLCCRCSCCCSDGATAGQKQCGYPGLQGCSLRRNIFQWGVAGGAGTLPYWDKKIRIQAYLRVCKPGETALLRLMTQAEPQSTGQTLRPEQSEGKLQHTPLVASFHSQPCLPQFSEPKYYLCPLQPPIILSSETVYLSEVLLGSNRSRVFPLSSSFLF